MSQVPEENNITYPIDPRTLLRKKKAIKRALSVQSGLLKKNIAILGGSTTAEIKDMLEIFLLNRGIFPRFYESEYNKYYEDARTRLPKGKETIKYGYNSGSEQKSKIVWESSKLPEPVLHIPLIFS